MVESGPDSTRETTADSFALFCVPVAIKTLKNVEDMAIWEQFFEEANTMRKFRHENVMQLVMGAYAPSCLMLV